MIAEPLDRDEAIARGRASLARGAWGEAFAQLAAVDRDHGLGPADLDRLAVAAHLTGREAEREELWARAHNQFLADDDTERAAWCAFWLGFTLGFRGEAARGSGWLSRARR